MSLFDWINNKIPTSVRVIDEDVIPCFINIFDNFYVIYYLNVLAKS